MIHNDPGPASLVSVTVTGVGDQYPAELRQVAPSGYNYQPTAPALPGGTYILASGSLAYKALICAFARSSGSGFFECARFVPLRHDDVARARLTNLVRHSADRGKRALVTCR